jgi:hypothetical protein
MALPDDQELMDELLNVRLEATALGGYRLYHDAGNHDDQAMSLGLAALALVEKTTSDLGGFSIPREVMAARKKLPPGLSDGTYDPYRDATIRGSLAAVRIAQRHQTEAQRRASIGLIVPGSVSDPRRLR